MSDILFQITSLLFFIFLLRNTIFWLGLWQVKEYRLDRLVVHLRETSQGRNLIFGFNNLFKIFLLALYVFSIFIPNLYSFYPLIVFILYLVLSIQILVELFNRKLKFPVFTPKILIIGLLAFIFEVTLFLIPLLDKYFWIVFLDKLLPFFISALIGVFSYPSDFYKDFIIDKAIDKLNERKDLLIIGITGSYGKGSTKEFAHKILSYKFNVLATMGTFNTPIGIAKTILSGLTAKNEIFLIEMGAYKVGEIREMCSFFKPKIGILTAVNEQHASLFGGISNIKKAKYELIESLPKDGFGLFNGNNENVLKLYNATKKKKVLYKADYFGESKEKADIKAINIKVGRFEIEFDVIYKEKKVGKFTVKLVGPHHIENILPGLYLGLSLGMNSADLVRSVKSILPSKKTMEPYLAKNGAAYIDDTYNANPAAVKAAVEYMKVYKGKKVLVLQPMIELGNKAAIEHEKVAKEVGATCDLLIATNKNFYKNIKKGIDDAGGRCQFIVKNPKSIADFIKRNVGKGDVVLFEGKESEPSFKLLESTPVYS